MRQKHGMKIQLVERPGVVPLWAVGVTAGLFSILSCPNTIAQAPTATNPASVSIDAGTLRRAKEIILLYGTAQKLSREQFRVYVNEEAYKTIASHKVVTPNNAVPADPTRVLPTTNTYWLNFDAYVKAHLYSYRDNNNMKWHIDPDDVAPSAVQSNRDKEQLRFKQDYVNSRRVDTTARGWDVSQKPGKVLESIAPEGLYQVNAMWHAIVDATVDAHWPHVVGHNSGDADANEVALYLANQAARRKRPRDPKDRYNKLAAGAVGGKITRKVAVAELELEQFEDLDTDDNGVIDINEFTARFKYDGAIKNDFLALAGPGFLITQATMLAAPTPAVLLDEAQTELETQANNDWQDIGNGLDAADQRLVIGNLDLRFDGDIAQEKTDKSLDVSGPGYVPGVGFMLSGNRRKTKDGKSIELDPNVDSTVFRILKKYNDTGVNATAGTLNWTNSLDSGSVFSTDMAFRLDWHKPNDLFRSGLIRPSIGIEISQAGKDDGASNAQRYFIEGTQYVRHTHRSALLTSSTFYFGPVFETGGTIEKVKTPTNADPNATTLAHKDVEKITGLASWEPKLNLKHFTTGVALPANRDVQYYVVPKMSLELGHITYRSAAANDVSASFFSPELQVGLIYRRLKLNYTLTQRNGLDGTHTDHLFQNLRLDFKLDDLGIATLSAGYQRGADSPVFQKVETFTLGLGVKL